jgi:hypothetical protein
MTKEDHTMADKKTPRTYRLSADTIRQLDFLAERMGGITDTDVITAAVAALFYSAKKNEQAPLLAALVPCSETGYELRVEGSVLLTCGKATVEALPEDFRVAALDGRMAPDSALTALILAAAWAKEDIVYNRSMITLYAGRAAKAVAGL